MPAAEDLVEFAVYSGVAVLLARPFRTVVTLVFEAGSGTRIGRDGVSQVAAGEGGHAGVLALGAMVSAWTFSNVGGISRPHGLQRLVTLKF